MFGIKNGMVMQRGTDNTCNIFIHSNNTLHKAWYKSENSSTKNATILNQDKELWNLTGIPVGGPYTVGIDSHEYFDIYVGDVWILAGQSNMQGVGFLQHSIETEQNTANPNIRALKMHDKWECATHPLHNLWQAVDKVHSMLGCGENIPNYVGPGKAFGYKMYSMTGVPQGLISCAHGGTTMAKWSPSLKSKGSESLYGAMYRRFISNGSSVKGMFWFQGCSQTNPENCATFVDDMIEFVNSCRNDFGKDMPFVQVQIARRADNHAKNPDWKCWNKIRELQRTLSNHIDLLLTVSSINRSVDDVIHIAGADQEVLGIQSAEAMYYLLYGADKNGCLPPPTFESCTPEICQKTGREIISVKYANLHGCLTSKDRPTGFLLRPKDAVGYSQFIYKTKIDNNTISLYIATTLDQLKNFELFYGYGANPYCNITDQANRSIPAMGPIHFE